MTYRTNIRTRGALLLGIKSRTVRIHVHVASHAIVLRMAGNAGRQALASGLAMSTDEESLRIMITSADGPVTRHQSGPLMTGLAERTHVVTVRALRLPSVCRYRVGLEETGRMVATSRRSGARSMAVETIRAHVTRGAGLGRSRRLATMAFAPPAGMGRGSRWLRVTDVAVGRLEVGPLDSVTLEDLGRAGFQQ